MSRLQLKIQSCPAQSNLDSQPLQCVRAKRELDWKIVSKDARLQRLDKTTLVRFRLHEPLLWPVKDGRVKSWVALLVGVNDILLRGLDHEEKLTQRPAALAENVLRGARNDRAEREHEEVHISVLVWKGVEKSKGKEGRKEGRKEGTNERKEEGEKK